jgi:hypothetical protein
MMRGLGWKIAMSPIEWTASRSKIGVQVIPLSVDRYIPPVELAT